jgi:hypothetical protein
LVASVVWVLTAVNLSVIALVGLGAVRKYPALCGVQLCRGLQVVGHPFGGSGFRVEQTAAAFDGPNE